MITVKEQKNGRIHVAADGWDPHYRAYVSGAQTCKISLPKKLWEKYAQDAESWNGTPDYRFCLGTMLRDIDSADRPKGVIVIHRSKVF